MKQIIQYIVGGVMLLFLSGCTTEDRKDCGYRLSYYYLLNKEYVNLFGPEVNRMHVYVFDKDKRYYDTFIFDNPGDLDTNNSLLLPLPRGTWHIVSWGGDIHTYKVGTLEHDSPKALPYFRDALVKGETTLEDFRLIVDYDEESVEEVVITKTPGKLFYGDYKMLTDGMTGATVAVMKNTNTLILKLSGIHHLTSALSTPSPLNNNGLNIYATIQNGRYDYRHNIAEYARKVSYLQPWNVDNEGCLEVSFTVMRLMENDDTGVLTIESAALPTGKVEIPIVHSILENPKYNNQDDLDREDTFTFELRISNDLYMTLYVNDWEIIKLYPN